MRLLRGPTAMGLGTHHSEVAGYSGFSEPDGTRESRLRKSSAYIELDLSQALILRCVSLDVCIFLVELLPRSKSHIHLYTGVRLEYHCYNDRSPHYVKYTT